MSLIIQITFICTKHEQVYFKVTPGYLELTYRM